MKYVRLIAAVATAASLSACASVETATRNAPLVPETVQPVSAALNIAAVNVTVPYSLRASEANSYYPMGDIVWRGEPLADRHQQVKAIFEDGLSKAAAKTQGSVPVQVNIEVERFHALTEKARYTVGGRHELQFTLQLSNPETGQAYTEPRKITTNIKAFGGARAIAAERNGITQRLRITDHIGDVVAETLVEAGGVIVAPSTVYAAVE